MASLTDGSFFKSSVRTSLMKLTICRRNVWEMPGTRFSTMRSSSRCSGKPMCRCRQRRLSASPSSRSLLEVRITVGGASAGDGAEFGYRDLKVRQDFKQQGSEFRIRLVDFVHQQHAALRLFQCLQQRPGFDEFLGKEHIAEIVELVQRGRERLGFTEDLAEFVLQDLGVEKLLGVFPLVERLGFIEPFVTLQADQLEAAPGGNGFGQFGFADAGRAFHEDRLFNPFRQVNSGR